jgi:alpha-tubulin suppressor-like RCC1 family protein
MYSCGYNTNGQLGLGTRTDEFSFKKVPRSETSHVPLATVVCGGYYTIVRSATGNLYGCGTKRSFTVVYYDDTDPILTKMNASFDSPVVFHDCGGSGAVCITETGSLYTIGDVFLKITSEFRKLALPNSQKAKHVSIGYRSIAVTTSMMPLCY